VVRKNLAEIHKSLLTVQLVVWAIIQVEQAKAWPDGLKEAAYTFNYI